MILKADFGILEVMPKLQPVNFCELRLSSTLLDREEERQEANLAGAYLTVLAVAKRGPSIIRRVERHLVGNGTAVARPRRQHLEEMGGS